MVLDNAMQHNNIEMVLDYVIVSKAVDKITLDCIYSQSWALNTFLYLNTKYMLKMYLNTKYFLQMYLNT